jgi:hypothetical protein
VTILQLDEITARINEAFGDDLPIARRSLPADQEAALERVFGDEVYQQFLQDQVNRQIIRDYLTNAILLGYLSSDRLDGLWAQVATLEGRSALSLHMLMTSVEDASTLPGACVPESLRPLRPPRPDTDTPPTLTLVPK